MKQGTLHEAAREVLCVKVGGERESLSRFAIAFVVHSLDHSLFTHLIFSIA